MKILAHTLAILAATVSLSLAGSEGWLTDWEAAKAKAKAEKKPILIDLTGSDWCGWCIKLDKEVFSQKAFKEYAEKNLILMQADFPRRKELPEALKKQNETLKDKYLEEGYPTVLLLDASGKKLTNDIGYREGGSEAYVVHLKDLLAKKKKK